MDSTILLLGDGFPAHLWANALRGAGVEFTHLCESFRGAYPDEGADVVIETEDIRLLNEYAEDEIEAADTEAQPPAEGESPEGNGHGHPRSTEAHEPRGQSDLRPGGILFVPCYASSATEQAAHYADIRTQVIGYTLFPPIENADAGTPVIEVARPLQAKSAAWERGIEFLKGVGYKPEIAGDAPGLVFGRTLACLINEAASALSDGIAGAADIDSAMRLGLNYPKGLLEWADELGIDLILDILEGLYSFYCEDRYRPNPLLHRMQLAGKRFRAD